MFNRAWTCRYRAVTSDCRRTRALGGTDAGVGEHHREWRRGASACEWPWSEGRRVSDAASSISSSPRGTRSSPSRGAVNARPWRAAARWCTCPTSCPTRWAPAGRSAGPPTTSCTRTAYDGWWTRRAPPESGASCTSAAPGCTPTRGDDWVTERSPVCVNAATEPLAVGEMAVQDAADCVRTSVVLRLGQVVGDTPLTRWTLRAAAAGRPYGVGDPDGFAHLVHSDDVGHRRAGLAGRAVRASTTWGRRRSPGPTSWRRTRGPSDRDNGHFLGPADPAAGRLAARAVRALAARQLRPLLLGDRVDAAPRDVLAGLVRGRREPPGPAVTDPPTPHRPTPPARPSPDRRPGRPMPDA